MPDEIIVQSRSEASQLLDVIRAVATDKDIDIAKVQAIFAMQRELQRDAERREFNAAMAQAQAAITPIVKNAENSDNHSKYVTLDAVGEAIDGIITRHGFSLIFRPQKSPEAGCLRVEATLAHSGGFEREIIGDVPIDATGLKGSVNKTATHAWGSTVTYARRYLTMMAFNVKSKTLFPDNDAKSKPPIDLISSDQFGTLKGALEQTKTDVDEFCRLYKIEALVDLPADRFNDAYGFLVQKAKRQKAAP